MSQPLLVLDVSYLCHRAFHSSKELSWQGKPTGVIFGFLKGISFFKNEFATDRVAFCFEHPHLFRRDIYPAYKRKRKTVERTAEEKKSYSSLVIQISELQHRYLPMIGFKNIFCQRGMESDDLMAALAWSTRTIDRDVILVTADLDLLQCLSDKVIIYSPQRKKLLTKAWFKKEYGLPPRYWWMVKAIAGCASDEVKGIKGVGEKTAIRYLRKELKESSKAYQSIVSPEGQEIMRRNKPLVRLPFRGCIEPEIQRDRITQKGWREVCRRLGMRSIAERPPVARIFE